jgi:hypothetical protein
MMNDKDVQALTDRAIRDAQMASTGLVIKIVIGIAIAIIIGCIVYFCYRVLAATPSQNEDTPVSEIQSTEQINQSGTESQKVRDNFKTALSEFESNIQPLLENPEIVDWNQDIVNQILDGKESAISNFAQGAYSTALQQLQESADNTESLVDEWNTAFENKYSEALTTFSEGQINRARLAMAQASKIKPTEPRLLSLQSQIDVYPQVAALYKKLKVARVENNLGKRIDILAEIVAVDPLQETAAVELKKAKRQRLELTFQRHINNGLNQLAEGNVKAAGQSHARARQIFPNRSEVQVLAKKLNHIEHDETLDTAHAQLIRLESNDDWKGVYQLVTRVEARFPGDQVISKYKETADAVLRLRGEASDYINRPHRLADDNIQRHAKQLIKEALPYLSKSQSLAQDIKVIGKHIDQYSVRFPVTIISDRKTQLVVKGVGTVGKTSQKVIQLAVGDYTLEGSRKGFRSKQLTFAVSGNQPNQISLVCDERI